jgi:hypothetical protein
MQCIYLNKVYFSLLVHNSFLILLFLSLSFPSHARQSCEWPFRTHVNVQENSSSGSQLTDYQVKFEISAADLSSDYTWSDNGQDLYIYDSDDQTELEFWIDDWNNSAKTAIIWVRFPTLEIGQVRPIYFYYGNASAPGAGDAPFTFTYPGIKFHTRYTNSNPQNLSQALNAFSASNDQNSSYGCSFITNFTGITNRSEFGANTNFAAFSESYFLVGPSEAGNWEFRYGSDFGHGGGLYVDGSPLEEQWLDNLWWAYNWGLNNEVLQGSINLTAGYHKLEILGFEDCCDGGITVQFKKPGGNWTTFSTSSIDIRSRACPLEQEPSFTIIGHDICRIDLGFDDSLSYPAAWVVNDSRPVSFAVENFSSSQPSIPNTRIAISLGAGLSMTNSSGNQWSCTTVSSSAASTEIDCLYALVIPANNGLSNSLTLNLQASSAHTHADFSATIYSRQFEDQLVNNQISTNLPIWQLAEAISPSCSTPNPGVFTRIYNSQGYSDNHPNNETEFDTWENDLAIRAKLDGNTVLNEINHNSGNPFALRSNNYYLTLIEGYLYAPEDGFYNFAVDGDDAVELKINDTVYSSWYGGHGAQNSPHDENTWGLSKGFHKLNYRMQEYTGGDSFYAYWRKPNQTSTNIIPTSAFFHCAGDDDIRLNMNVIMQDNPDIPGDKDKAIPGAILRYHLSVKNHGNISATGDSMELIQPLSNDAKLYVNNLYSSGPVLFSDGLGNDISGLSYNFSNLNSHSDHLSFSNNNGTSYDYIPVADSEGYDGNITHIKLTFTGIIKPVFDQGIPQFDIEYQIKIK